MASISALFLCFSLFLIVQSQPVIPLNVSSPFFSPTTILNYQKMLQKFKVFIYEPNTPEFHYATPEESLFYTTLQKSQFVTQNPDEAHLFFVPFSPEISTRSLARLIGTLRAAFPYWNRSLGADHFFLSCAGVGHDSNRNTVELKKNSVQISCFPRTVNGGDDVGYFIPHKDISLPPVTENTHSPSASASPAKFLGYFRRGGVETTSSKNLIGELVKDPEFLIETEPSDGLSMSRSKFCVLEYWNDVSWIGEALRAGCVPVVIADRPVNDLPFMDVLRWQEMAVFLRSGVGIEELKKKLNDTWRDGSYENKRGLCVAASRHFVWNEEPQPLDSFNTVMYQLWLRRHVIRYTRAELNLASA